MYRDFLEFKFHKYFIKSYSIDDQMIQSSIFDIFFNVKNLDVFVTNFFYKKKIFSKQHQFYYRTKIFFHL